MVHIHDGTQKTNFHFCFILFPIVSYDIVVGNQNDMQRSNYEESWLESMTFVQPRAIGRT